MVLSPLTLVGLLPTATYPFFQLLTEPLHSFLSSLRNLHSRELSTLFPFFTLQLPQFICMVHHFNHTFLQAKDHPPLDFMLFPWFHALKLQHWMNPTTR